MQTVTDQLGYVTTVTLNSNGDAVREVGPTGSITKRTFDGDHRLLSETMVVGLEDSVENGETNDLTTAPACSPMKWLRMSRFFPQRCG